MTQLSIAEQKNALRDDIRLKLKSLSKEQLQVSSTSLCKQIAQWLESHPEVHTITSFAHLPFEPDLSSLHQLLPQHRIAYPHATKGGSMEFYQVTCPTQMQAGYYGLRQPIPSGETLVPNNTIDLVLCPAFAFTSNGERLGKGGGYYDRFLSQLKDSCHILGIALPCQMVDHIPTECHDLLVDQVLIA
ncbi:5-formyltetrahydrofolate cyclo-ligase [Rubritalea squalenifaciens DSM 18772]|uniref:5-formyltetrahydrofolate cyclo-ligase n=1 Tax=Rubritalea squalenifaciens DSM 18772 TaxID=1123071 RepID=A0A1M6HR63_9BACT|nr:5-formyltetrahydrofolate cyclo-ligase [Rubritalea squalenifaciens]SHJ24712.1 5-formyltetrahydrofolate cyclo-ligase [Rubritalea squalenifaciens DSM 18772]